MKRTLMLAALALSASLAQATTVNFDDLGNVALPANYAGINWDSNWIAYADSQAPYNPSSGTTRIYGGTFFDFASPTTFNGAYFAGYSTYSVSFNLYLSNVLVGSSSTLTLSGTPTFLSSGYSGQVDRVEVVGTPSYFVMDDVTYNEAFNITSAPEPATYLLTSGALAAIALRRRKRA